MATKGIANKEYVRPGDWPRAAVRWPYARHLSALAKAKGYRSFAALAREAGVAAPTIYHMMAGRTPRTSTVDRLLGALGATMDVLATALDAARPPAHEKGGPGHSPGPP